MIITQHYTDYEYSKVRGIAEASLSGPATNIISGMAVGLESTGASCLVIGIALVGWCLVSLQVGVFSLPRLSQKTKSK